jgi:large subunit ribosomal protein L25
MRHFQLSANTRTVLGNSVRKLRKQGLLPAVLYGQNFNSLPIQIDKKTFLKLYKQVGKTNVIDLSVDSQTLPVIVQDLDIDPVFGDVRHVDFLVVNLKQKVKVTVPIQYIGTPIGVKQLGAVLAVNLDELEIEVLPEKIPDFITVDVTNLTNIHDSISVADLLQVAQDYEILNDPETILVSLTEGASGVEEANVEVTEPVVTQKTDTTK